MVIEDGLLSHTHRLFLTGRLQAGCLANWTAAWEFSRPTTSNPWVESKPVKSLPHRPVIITRYMSFFPMFNSPVVVKYLSLKKQQMFLKWPFSYPRLPAVWKQMFVNNSSANIPQRISAVNLTTLCDFRGRKRKTKKFTNNFRVEFHTCKTVDAT